MAYGVVLVSLLLTLNVFHTLFYCFYCWLWTYTCQVGKAILLQTAWHGVSFLRKSHFSHLYKFSSNDFTGSYNSAVRICYFSSLYSMLYVDRGFDDILCKCNTLVIRRKVESQDDATNKQSTLNFPKNEHFLPPDAHTNVCISGGKKCLLFGKFGVLCFLVTPVLRLVIYLHTSE